MALDSVRLRADPGVIPWAGLSLLLLVGILVTLLDLHRLPHRDALRANHAGQRAIIDPTTGAVSLGQEQAATAAKGFDVGSPDPVKEPVKDPAVVVEAQKPVAVAPTSESTTAQSAPSPANQGDLPLLRTQAPKIELKLEANPKERLVPAPAPEITEKIDGLALPRKGQNDSSPSTIYARHFNPVAGQHVLAIVLLDAGINAQSLPLLTVLPREVTLAFSPYTRDGIETIATLRRAGYETWTMLPLMSERYPQDDPGPYGLLSSLPRDTLLHRLRQTLAATIGSPGVVLPPDEILSKRSDNFLLILSDILNRGMYVLSTHPTHSLDQLTHDKEQQKSLTRATLQLDPTTDTSGIEAKLNTLPELIKNNPSTIVVASARPQTLRILIRWLNMHPQPALAPLSATYRASAAAATAEKPKEDPKAEEGKGKEPAKEKDVKKEPEANNIKEPEAPKEGPLTRDDVQKNKH